jgi:formylglycine-generating enzyme
MSPFTRSRRPARGLGRRLSSGRRRRLAAAERLETRAMLSGNEPPVNHVPGPQAAVSDVPLAFTAYLGNPISVSDPDAGGNPVRVSLAVDSGGLTLVDPDPRGGLTYSVGDGVEDAAMTFTGTLADINEALAWVSYRSAADFTGAATITITTNDLGMVGTGGAKSDTDTIESEVGPPPAFSPSPSHETLPAVLDTSFNGTGKQVLAISDRTAGVDYVHDMRVLPDGKILAVGAIDDRFGIMRFNPDMTLDESFGTAWQGYGWKAGGGTTVLDFGLGVHANSLAVDREGRILVGGGDKVVRLTAAGVIDTTFGIDGVSSGVAPIVAIRADGTILATGQTNPLTIPGISMYRISASGEKLDSWAYDPLGFGYDYARAIIPLGDGDAIIAGRASHQGYYFDYGFYTARINATGGLEEEFNSKFRPDSQPYYAPFINSAVPLPDGRFLAVGVAYDDVAVSRHLASGELDTTFGDSGLARIPVLTGTDTGYRATLTADGKILIAGFAHNGVNQDVAVVRLDFDGQIDTTFGIDGAVTTDLGGDDLGFAVAPLPDGKILVAGRSGNRIAMVRLLGDVDLVAVPEMPPVAPHQIRVLPGNMANELWVSWELPDTLNGPFIQDYVVEVSANHGETWQRIDDGVSLNRYASLPNLDSARSYSVRVAAVGNAGIGRWSWPSVAVRPQGASIDLVHVGDPGNFWDTNNLNSSQGDALYEYRIGTYEITIGQYVEFLNATARTDTYSLYNPAMATDLQVAGIARQGSDGGYTYSVIDNGGSSAVRPITYVSWFDAARFANWLQNGRPIGLQGPGTTETGAYTLAGMVEGIPPTLNPAARFSIPTNDQWYKAAFYDPDLDSGNGGFWTYATRSDAQPGNQTGSLPNQANVVSGGVSLNQTTAVGGFPGSGSRYGTFDQLGNVEEWTSWAVSGTNSSGRAIRGGSFRSSVDPGQTLVRDRIGRQAASYEGRTVGFRLAAPFDPQPFAAATLFAAPIAELAPGSESRPVLAWQMPEPVAEIELTGFVVQRSDDVGGTWVTVDASLSSDRMSYEFTDLVDGQSYLLRVAARSPAGVGAFSTPVMATFDAVEPPRIVLTGDTVLEREWYEPGTIVGTLAVVGGRPGDVFSYEITSQNAATVLARRYQLDRFIVEAYRDIHADAIISESQLDELIAPLNQQEYPPEISGLVFSIRGILEVIVYDTAGEQVLHGKIVDDGSFEIVGNEVRVTPSGSYGDGNFDREAVGGYAIGIRATNQEGVSVEQSVIIEVADVNEPPIAVALSSTTIAENQPAGSVIGEFTTTDPDWGDTATYRLVAGEGSADNGWFTIAGGSLRAASAFDFEARSSYSIRVRATDRGGLWTENVFTVDVTDVAEDRKIVTVPGESVVIDGPITGSDRIVVRGGGRVVLASGNAHSGGIVVEAGELLIRDPVSILRPQVGQRYRGAVMSRGMIKKGKS